MVYDITTVFWREWLVLKRRLGKFIFARMVSPLLYLVAFGWGLGSHIQGYQGRYLDFVVPGIIALNSMLLSFNAVSTPVNMSRLYHKTLEEYLTAPIAPTAFVLGKILSGMTRGMISSGIIIVLAYLFGAHFSIGLFFWSVLLLNSAVFAAMGFVAAMCMDSHEDMSNFSTYVLTPMSFLCATFFALERLPLFFQYFLNMLPLTHTSMALRLAAQGNEPLWSSLGVLVFYTIALSCLGIWQLRRTKE